MPRLPPIPETILVAPDSFKGTFTAGEVAAAIGRGLERAGRPVELCPVADGGEGTLAILLDALGGELVATTVEDPLGRPIEAGFGLLTDERARRIVAIVETASASGLTLVDERERDPIAASTFGTGELIAAAVAAGAETVYLGVGGSATTDGGAGALRAIARAGGLGDARLVVLCDVRTVFEEAAQDLRAPEGRRPRAGQAAHQAAARPGAPAAARPARGADDRRRRRSRRGPVGRARGRAGAGGRVHARPARLRRADARGARGRDRRGPDRPAEPRGQGGVRGRDAVPSVRGPVPRDHGRARPRRVRRADPRPAGDPRGDDAGRTRWRRAPSRWPDLDQLWANAARLSPGIGAVSDSRNSVFSRI